MYGSVSYCLIQRSNLNALPGSKRRSGPRRFSDWCVLKLTNSGQIRHLMRNGMVYNDLESNWEVGWEVMMDHVQVETMSRQTASW